MKLADLLKTALDELRMQMLGAEVLFGFQFEGCFQSGFEDLSFGAHIADAAALSLIVTTLALVIAAPSQHRIVEQGRTTERILHVAEKYSGFGLFPFSLAIGCDFYVVLSRYLGSAIALASSVAATAMALFLWYGLCAIFKKPRDGRKEMQMDNDRATTLHGKIEHMLTEARVILPGAQALLGFQFIVTLTKSFEKLSYALKIVHFIGLSALALSIILLIAPAAIHRMTFHGQDSERFHSIGSIIVTLALLPLVVAIVCDIYIALNRMLNDSTAAGIGAAAALLLLMSLWYILPLFLRANHKAHYG